MHLYIMIATQLSKNFLKMSYKVTVTAMQSQLNDKAENMTRSFDFDHKANTYFNELCDELNLDNVEDESEGFLSGGGRGYDFRVEIIKD